MKWGSTRGAGILLIHPPVAKSCEPPAGVARLAGALVKHGVSCRIWDANLEGQLALMHSTAQAVATEHPARPGEPSGTAFTDTWTRRAARHLGRNLAMLRSPEGYAPHPDRYRRAVLDLNRLLAVSAKSYTVRLNLADYEDDRLSPLRSADLLAAAASPETNPFYPHFANRLLEILAETPVSHVGFSINFLSQALTAFAMIGFLRRCAPRLRIVLGGGLITSWMRRPGWRDPFAGLADLLVDGPGEARLLALWGKTDDDCGAPPDFGGLPLTDYLAPGLILPYSASGGCWWRRCSFCPEQAEQNPYRPIPPGRVTADLRALTGRLRPALIHLLDNALSPAHLDALAAEPPGAPWYGFTRIMPRLADRDFVRRLREAGCVMLKLGLESGDQGVLDALRKGFDLGLATAVLENLRVAGITTYVYLLFGTPAETPEAARRTLAFAATHAREIGFLNLAVFNLPRYGPEAQDLDTAEFYAGDLSLYRRFVHPQGWDRSEVRRFAGEFRRHPAVAGILRREPPLFTSNHAPFVAPTLPA
jgi:hypothetical protein